MAEGYIHIFIEEEKALQIVECSFARLFISSFKVQTTFHKENMLKLGFAKITMNVNQSKLKKMMMMISLKEKQSRKIPQI